MDEQTIQMMIDEATELVNKRSDDKNHTVAATILTKNGKTFSSMNFYHFTGGPDAEVAAMARVATEGENPIAIVAVGHNNRGVVSLCGRCRQTVFDYYPEMQVIMPDDNGYKVMSIKDLLPETFDWNAQQ